MCAPPALAFVLLTFARDWRDLELADFARLLMTVRLCCWKWTTWASLTLQEIYRFQDLSLCFEASVGSNYRWKSNQTSWIPCRRIDCSLHSHLPWLSMPPCLVCKFVWSSCQLRCWMNWACFFRTSETSQAPAAKGRCSSDSSTTASLSSSFPLPHLFTFTFRLLFFVEREVAPLPSTTLACTFPCRFACWALHSLSSCRIDRRSHRRS